MIYLLQLPENSRSQTPYVLIQDQSEQIDYKLFKKIFTTTRHVSSKYGAFVKLTDDQQEALDNEKYAMYDHSFQFLRRADIEYEIIQSYDELPDIKEPCLMCDPCFDGRNFDCINM